MTVTSYYFNLNELRCKDGTVYPVEWMETRWPDLAATLDTIREAWGSPLRVLSGYRTPEYNRKIGGAKKSQHVEGRAVDLKPVKGTPAELHRAILEMHAAGRLPMLGGLGEYRTFVHVDVREGPRLVRWRGKSLTE